jgi:parallel beta-helix repeat protein
MPLSLFGFFERRKSRRWMQVQSRHEAASCKTRIAERDTMTSCAMLRPIHSEFNMKIIALTRRAFRPLLVAGLTSMAALVHAATYYVAPTGSNSNPGSISAPFQTLQKAHDVANPGDTIYMRGGTYMLSDSGISISRSGTSSSRITVANYPGEVPVLDGSAMTTASRSGIEIRGNAAWWNIRGLEIKSAPFIGILLTGTSSNITVERCVLHHNTRVNASGAGIQIASTAGGNILILNNDSHHNGKLGTSGGDGIGNSSAAAGNVIRGNRVYRNNDDGIDLWGAVGTLVEGNWSWENGKKDDLTPTGGNGVGLKLGGGTSGDGQHNVRNNVVWRNQHSGLEDNGANLPMNVFNNTAWENGVANFSFYTRAAFVLKNNLSFPNSLVYFPAAEVIRQNNSWNLAVTVTSADFTSLDYSGAAGPRNADGSLPSIGFLKLAAGSDLIGKGVDVGLPFSGSAPDLGAYETSGTLPAPTGLTVVPQ